MIRFKQLFYENRDTSASRLFSQDALKGVGGFKSRSLLVEMPLDDFLNLAEPLPAEQQRGDAEKWFKEGSLFDDVPFIKTDLDRVTGHEGRHRAILFKKLGYSTMPVEFRDYVIRWGEEDPKDFPETLKSEDGEREFNYPITDDLKWGGLTPYEWDGQI
jgi:hypothetical protein